MFTGMSGSWTNDITTMNSRSKLFISLIGPVTVNMIYTHYDKKRQVIWILFTWCLCFEVVEVRQYNS